VCGTERENPPDSGGGSLSLGSEGTQNPETIVSQTHSHFIVSLHEGSSFLLSSFAIIKLQTSHFCLQAKLLSEFLDLIEQNV
jgi:hypothetical protein